MRFLKLINAVGSWTNEVRKVPFITESDFGSWSAWPIRFYPFALSMAFTPDDEIIARYKEIGKVVHFFINVTGTTSVFGAPTIECDLPVPARLPVMTSGALVPKRGIMFPGIVDDNSAGDFIGFGRIVAPYTAVANDPRAGPSRLQCFKFDMSNFGLGANRVICIGGTYERA